MKSLLLIIPLFINSAIHAQKSVPDSVMKGFARLTCECATLMKIDKGTLDEGISKLETCMNSTMDVYTAKGWIKSSSLNDTAWTRKFNQDLDARLAAICPAFKKMAAKAQPKVPDAAGQADEKYFISKEFMTGNALNADAAGTSGMMHRWSSFNKKSRVMMVFDIRFVFNNEADAKTYYKVKLTELREGGTPTTRSLNSFGASESMVYGGNPKLLQAFGDIDLAQTNFVFRVKNIVAKVFVGSSKKATYDEVLIFAKEAIRRIKAAN